MNCGHLTRTQRAGGFTMIEIALCLAIVAFAMAAIMGVLPAGLQVQKSNRDDTIINQEGTYLMQAIRTGALGLDDLTNYVEWIAIASKPGSWPPTKMPPVTTPNFFLATNPTNTIGASAYKLTNGATIIGLLSNPLYQYDSTGRFRTTNTVVGRFHTMSGLAAEKNRNASDFAFSYLARVEIQPYEAYAPGFTNFTSSSSLLPLDPLSRSNRWVQAQYLSNNLFEVRLTLSWPVRPTGATTGSGQQVFRSLVSGRLTHLAPGSGSANYTNLYFFQPNYYGL